MADQMKMQTLPDGRHVKMWRLPTGKWIEVGDKDEVGAEIGVLGKTYSNYVRWGTPQGDPAPGPVGIHPTTRRDLFPMDDVRAWHSRRPGPGDHTGIGARRRWARERQAREEGTP